MSGFERQVNLEQLAELAAELAAELKPPKIVYLHGSLGSGKTTLVRALLRVLGCKTPVPSPTFSLQESYDLACATIHHFDLYRIENIDELEYLGIADRIDDRSVLLFEWPERALDSHGRFHLPKPDIDIYLDYAADDAKLRVIKWSKRC